MINHEHGADSEAEINDLLEVVVPVSNRVPTDNK